jgi:hypothetical protein
VLAKLTIRPEPQYYGWPDHTADFLSVTEERFQPPMEMVLPSGYPEVSPLLDLSASKLSSPTRFRDDILGAVFPSQSGAAKMDFAPASGPFKQYADEAIVALSGDRAPFATGGRPLTGPIGYKVVRVNVESGKKQAVDFVRNTSGKPGSLSSGGWALERPIDVKFGPDGAMYILDFGRMTVVNGKERISGGTGRIYRVVPTDRTSPATQPAVATHR